MFSGAMTATVTPFKDGRLDEARLKEQVEFQITGGIDGLVPVGTTGESPTVDFKEHARVIELNVQFARGRISTATARSRAAAIARSSSAEWCGPSAT